MKFSYDFNSFVVYAGICMGWVLLNIRAISVIVTMPRSRSRPSTWLTAHMAVLAILANYTAFVYLASKIDTFSINRFFGICQIFTVIADLTLSLVPLNMMALNYDRVIKCHAMNQTGKVMTTRILVAQWIVALICSLPSGFTVHHFEEFGKDRCKQEPIFGLNVLNILIEMLRLVLLDFFVIGYILQTMQKVRKKHHYLYIIRPFHDMIDREKLNKVRVSFILAAVFIVIWFPLGFVVFIHRLLHLYNIPCGYVDPVLRVTVIIAVLYISFYPIVLNMMNGNLNYISWYKFCWKPRENDTLLTRLTQEMYQEARFGERRLHRRQLRQEHLELSEEETADLGASGSYVNLQILDRIPETKVEEEWQEEEDESIYSPVQLTLVRADVVQPELLEQNETGNDEITGGADEGEEEQEEGTPPSFESLCGVSSDEHTTTPDDGDEDACSNNYYSVSSTPTMENIEMVSDFITADGNDADDEHNDYEDTENDYGDDYDDLGQMNCNTSNLDFDEMVQYGHSETMV